MGGERQKHQRQKKQSRHQKEKVGVNEHRVNRLSSTLFKKTCKKKKNHHVGGGLPYSPLRTKTYQKKESKGVKPHKIR